MPTIAELLVKIEANTSGINQQLDAAAKKAESTGSRFDKAGDSFSRAGDKMIGVGKKATLGLTLPLGAAAVAATNAASDLNESLNAIEVVFGRAAGRVERFGETAEQSIGLSQRAFNELVTPVGAALQNVGFSQDEAAQASINLAKRAADMASVFNTDVSDALEAIQAGLRGEADPLERFGVGLSAAATEAKAMELGLADATSELTAQDKAQARLALFMEQTDKVAGDFANTAGSVANQERIATAEAENMAASFGQQLIPLKQRLIDLAKQVIAVFNNMSPSMQRNVLIAAGLAAALGPLLIGLGAITRGVGGMIKGLGAAGRAFVALNAIMRANPFLLIVSLIAGLIAIIVVAWKRSETFRRIVMAVWNGIKSAISAVVNWITGTAWPFIRRVWNGIASGARAMRDGVVGAWNWIRDKIGAAVDGIKGFLSGIWDGIVSGAKAAVNGAIRVINGIIGGINSVTGVVGIPAIPKIPMLAEGGIVTGPTLAMLGERGDEAVIPLPRGLSQVGGGQVIEIRGDGSARADFLIEELRAAIRERGGLELALGGAT